MIVFIKESESIHRAKGPTDEIMILYKGMTVMAHNYFFDKRYKNGTWDGTLKLMYEDGTHRQGLTPWAISICVAHGIEYRDETNQDSNLYSAIEIRDWLLETNKILPYPMRDYQQKALSLGVMKRKCVIESPTASGKSLIIYALMKWFYDHRERDDDKFLVIVPNISLVKQLQSDFKEYESELSKPIISDKVHGVMGGINPVTELPIVVSTYQSLVKMSGSYYVPVSAVIVDECHGAKAKTIDTILEYCHFAKYRIGLTGSLSKIDVNNQIIQGVLGEFFKVASSENLIKRGILSNMQIGGVIVNYPAKIQGYFSQNVEYQNEINFITKYTPRQDLIVDMAASRKDGNVLILFARVEAGKYILSEIRKRVPGYKKIFYVDARTHVDEREFIRVECERDNDNIIVASVGCFGTGINIKRIHYLFMAHPFKSQIKILQSIGRGLRKSEHKDKLIVFDIVDNLGGNHRECYSMRHYKERKDIYSEQGFPLREIFYEMEGKGV